MNIIIRFIGSIIRIIRSIIRFLNIVVNNRIRVDNDVDNFPIAFAFSVKNVMKSNVTQRSQLVWQSEEI